LARLTEWQSRLGGAPEFLLPGEEDFGPFGPVFDALLSDLNTPEAIGRLHSIGREVVNASDAGKLSSEEVEAARHGLALVLQSLGLVLPSSGVASKSVVEAVPAWVEALAAERQEARRSREWKLADQLRDQIREAGWSVLDGSDGFTLEPVEAEKPT
ncbi:MAG: DALR domain-containing protein, partial [Verrucomicrobiota bacterium]